MAIPKYNWPNNPPPTSSFDLGAEDLVVKPGIYNKAFTPPTGSITTSSVFWATGSNHGVVALVAKSGNFEAYLAGGGMISGSFLDAGIIHDLGITKIITKGAEVTLLYSVR